MSSVRQAKWQQALTGALDGSAFTIPLSLGCVTVVYAQIGAGMVASGVFATMLALVWIHLTTAHDRRPILYSARFFEATTLAAMLERTIPQLATWQVPDTPGVRMALLCVICLGAGLTVGVLYLLRADRFTRFIPAPVFAGFSNAIALVLFMTQSRSLLAQFRLPDMTVAVSCIAVPVLAAAFAVRRWVPRWPAAAVGLGLGLLISLGFIASGLHPPMVSAQGSGLALPVASAEFAELWSQDADTWAMAGALLGDACILGAMMFINTTMTSEIMSQADDRRQAGIREQLWSAASVAVLGLLGSLPISGSVQSSAAATRNTRMSAGVLLCCAAVTAVVHLSGVLLWVPLAAVCGALLCEAWFMVDRGSLRLLRDWVRRRTQVPNAGEDLALVAAVTISAVLFNMVAAVFVGLLLGLVIFAARNARQPVRNVWSGHQLSSNCARSRAELKLLSQHGGEIRVFELEGDLFFGAADGLARRLRADLADLTCVVIDWSRVRHLDTSLAQTVVKFERHATGAGLQVVHAAAGAPDSRVGGVLHQHLPAGRFEPDLDHALEAAENQVIQRYGLGPEQTASITLEGASLFNGLSDAERCLLESRMEVRRLAKGDVVIESGAPSDELMLVTQGSASVVVKTPAGKTIRLAGVRAGATIGEIGFLDRAPRSATIIAQDDLVLQVLNRPAYEQLSRDEPALVRQLLANIALDVAARLRHTNRLAMARQGQS